MNEENPNPEAGVPPAPEPSVPPAPPVPKPRRKKAAPKIVADPPGDASIPPKLDDSAEGRAERKAAAKKAYSASPPHSSRVARKARSSQE